ncbi:MAG: hypothetical protein NTW20_08655 [Rhodobacterales bacterium]|nr:hypothetical protein [Rhodobacterales bacterium]
MRWAAAILAFWPTLALADGWEQLDGPGIVTALTARVLGYADGPSAGGALQDFFADGRTLYGDQWGRWEVWGDLYCSVWPPSDRWSCYTVSRQGLDIRFSTDGGEVSVGRYVDLD